MDAELLQQLALAKHTVAEAEGDLALLLRDVQSGVRAEKVTISEALQKALNKLRAAREQLARLERLAPAKLQ